MILSLFSNFVSFVLFLQMVTHDQCRKFCLWITDPVHRSQHESGSLFWACDHHGKMERSLGEIHSTWCIWQTPHRHIGFVQILSWCYVHKDQRSEMSLELRYDWCDYLNVWFNARTFLRRTNCIWHCKTFHWVYLWPISFIITPDLFLYLSSLECEYIVTNMPLFYLKMETEQSIIVPL